MVTYRACVFIVSDSTAFSFCSRYWNGALTCSLCFRFCFQLQGVEVLLWDDRPRELPQRRQLSIGAKFESLRTFSFVTVLVATWWMVEVMDSCTMYPALLLLERPDFHTHTPWFPYTYALIHDPRTSHSNIISSTSKVARSVTSRVWCPWARDRALEPHYIPIRTYRELGNLLWSYRNTFIVILFIPRHAKTSRCMNCTNQQFARIQEIKSYRCIVTSYLFVHQSILHFIETLNVASFSFMNCEKQKRKGKEKEKKREKPVYSRDECAHVWKFSSRWTTGPDNHN